MKRVAIDVGHAKGTGSRGNVMEEHELCARMAPLLKNSLAKFGISSDIIDFPDLTNKSDLVQTADAINDGDYECSVSLHCDASDNASAKGAHVCYVFAKGKKLASLIADRLCTLMPGRADSIVRRTDLYILNHTKCTAVLVECGFITNAHDAAMLSENAQELMEAVACGIYEFFLSKV